MIMTRDVCCIKISMWSYDSPLVKNNEEKKN